MNKIFDFMPEELLASLPVGEIFVYTTTGARNAAVQLEPMVADDKDAIKAIEKAIVERQGNKLVVRVDDRGGSGGMTVIQSGRGSISVSGAGGSIVIGGGNVVMSGGGRVIQHNGGQAVQIGGGGVRAIIHAPSSISADLRTTAGVIQVTGDLAKLIASASSGDIRAMGQITEAEVDVSSGNADLGVVARLEASASSGNLSVQSVREKGRVRVSSGNASVHTQTANFRARASSGSLRITTAPGVVLDEDDITVSSGSRRVSVKR